VIYSTFLHNAQVLAEWLEKQHNIVRVYYPGLTSHPDHVLAKSQMNGFTGMMSFELNQRLDRTRFEKALEIIQPVVSLAGVESTITVPSITSHNSLTPKEKSVQGIGDNLIRFSVGIEAVEDLQQDLDRALKFAANEG
jgi:cystathionine beta-lyase